MGAQRFHRNWASYRPVTVCLSWGPGCQTDRVAGHALRFVQLASTLPVFPLLIAQAPAVTDDTPPQVQALAELHLENLRRRYPRGPYRLIGVSFGGLVAFEVAARLEAAGKQLD